MSKSASKMERIAAMLKVLGNTNRLMIFLRISSDCARERECCPDEESLQHCIGDMARELGIVASTASHHLKELRQAGLVQVQRRGKSVHCWVDEKSLAELASFFGELVIKGSKPDVECAQC